MRYPSKKRFIAKIEKLEPRRNGLKRLRDRLRRNTVRKVLNKYLDSSFNTSHIYDLDCSEIASDARWLLNQINFSYDEVCRHRVGIVKIHPDDVILSLNYWTTS